jgi:hypothetical protein
MSIPYINTIDDIKEILNQYCIVYKQLSDEMYWIGLSDKYQIGSIAISLNEIRCRFHYTDGSRIYANAFNYNKEEFTKELQNAQRAWQRKCNKDIEKILDIL